MGQNRSSELDVLRGIAVSMVFLFHALGYSYYRDGLAWEGMYRSFDVPLDFLLLMPFQFGSLGVAIFFAVSGYCIHFYCGNFENIRIFFAKRALRIIPPYWFVLVLLSVVPFISLELFKQSLEFQFITHFFLVHNFSEKSLYGIAPAWWSIAIELQLYFLYPLLLVLLKRFGWNLTLFFLLIIEITIRLCAVFFATPDYITHSPFAFCLSWSLGAWAADRRRAGIETKLTAWGNCIMLCICISMYFYRPLTALMFPFVALWTALFLTKRSHSFSQGKLTALICKAGIISYSFYLIMDPIAYNISQQIAFIESPLLRFFITSTMIIPTYFIALQVWKIVEFPSHQLSRQVSNVRRAQP